MEKSSSGDNESSTSLSDLIRLLAWGGGLWFFITNMVVQPFFTKFVYPRMPEHYRTLGNKLFFSQEPAHSLEGDLETKKKIADEIESFKQIQEVPEVHEVDD